MPDGTATASLDLPTVQKLITDAIKPLADAVADSQKNQKVIADTLAADAKARADAEAAGKAKAEEEAKKGTAEKKPEPLTAEAASKLISDGVAAALKARDDAAQSNAARNTFVAEKMKDVPEAYLGKLGNDPAKFAAEEQAIRDALKADLAKLGVTVKDVSGGATGGTTGGSAAEAKPGTVGQFKAAGLSDGEAEFASQVKMPA